MPYPLLFVSPAIFCHPPLFPQSSLLSTVILANAGICGAKCGAGMTQWEREGQEEDVFPAFLLSSSQRRGSHSSDKRRKRNIGNADQSTFFFLNTLVKQKTASAIMAVHEKSMNIHPSFVIFFPFLFYVSCPMRFSLKLIARERSDKARLLLP